MIEQYIGVRQNNEIDVLREYNIENLFLEFTNESKWKVDDDYTKFSMVWKYTSGDFNKFKEAVKFWKDFLEAIIIPPDKEIDFDMVFYNANTKEELFNLIKNGITHVYASARIWREANNYANVLAKKNHLESPLWIVRGDKFQRNAKHIFATISYFPLDNAIAKRVLVYRFGKREIRPIDKFAKEDFKVSLNSMDLGIDYNKITNGNFLEIFKFNVLGYWMYDVKKKRRLPRWIEEYEKAKMRGEDLSWTEELDRKGHKKITYLSSRYNRIKHGLYAKTLKNENIICDTCPIRDVCPFYEEGAVCAFTTIWRDIGDTRNSAWVLSKLEEIIAEEYARYMRATYIEGMSGEVANKEITKLGDALTKHLEIYNRILSGSKDIVVGGGINLNVTMTLDEALEDVRKRYGTELADKIKERLENE